MIGCTDGVGEHLESQFHRQSGGSWARNFLEVGEVLESIKKKDVFRLLGPDSRRQRKLITRWQLHYSHKMACLVWGGPGSRSCP